MLQFYGLLWALSRANSLSQKSFGLCLKVTQVVFVASKFGVQKHPEHGFLSSPARHLIS